MSKKKAYNVPGVDNLIKTIEGLELMWKRVKKLGFQTLNLRFLNQDQLEIFFGCVRSYSKRNYTRPTCGHFKSTFKCLLLNNLTSNYTMGAYCTKDPGYYLFKWPQFLPCRSKERMNDNKDDRDTSDRSTSLQPTLPFVHTDFNATQIINNVKVKLSSEINNCPACNTYLCSKNRFFNSTYHCIKSGAIEKVSQILNSANLLGDTVKYISSKLADRDEAHSERYVDCEVDCVNHRLAVRSAMISVIVERVLCSITRSLNTILEGKMFDSGVKKLIDVQLMCKRLVRCFVFTLIIETRKTE